MIVEIATLLCVWYETGLNCKWIRNTHTRTHARTHRITRARAPTHIYTRTHVRTHKSKRKTFVNIHIMHTGFYKIALNYRIYIFCCCCCGRCYGLIDLLTFQNTTQKRLCAGMCFPTTTKQAKILETLLAKLSAPQALSRVLFCFCLEGGYRGKRFILGFGSLD